MRCALPCSSKLTQQCSSWMQTGERPRDVGQGRGMRVAAADPKCRICHRGMKSGADFCNGAMPPS